MQNFDLVSDSLLLSELDRCSLGFRGISAGSPSQDAEPKGRRRIGPVLHLFAWSFSYLSRHSPTCDDVNIADHFKILHVTKSNPSDRGENSAHTGKGSRRHNTVSILLVSLPHGLILKPFCTRGLTGQIVGLRQDAASSVRKLGAFFQCMYSRGQASFCQRTEDRCSCKAEGRSG